MTAATRTEVPATNRLATFKVLAQAIKGGLPVPQVITIPTRITQDGRGVVSLVVDDRAAVVTWAAWLGDEALVQLQVQAHPLPDRSTRHDVRLDDWLGWTAIVVSARVRPSTRGGA